MQVSEEKMMMGLYSNAIVWNMHQYEVNGGMVDHRCLSGRSAKGIR